MSEYKVTPEQRNGATWFSVARLRRDGYYDAVCVVPAVALPLLNEAAAQLPNIPDPPSAEPE